MANPKAHPASLADPSMPAGGADLVAAIDIGTVSTRLVVARTRTDRGFDVLERQARITDLGEGVDASGRLAPAAVVRTVATVDGYLARIRAHLAAGGEPHAVVAATTTSAARDAANADDLLGPLRACGLAPQVIAGDTEAALALLGVTADFPDDVLVADVGGGSTELTAGRRDADGSLRQNGCASYNVGCRRVAERFFADGRPATPAAETAARAFVASVLAPHFAGGRSARLPATLVCVGGTATSLVAVEHALVPYDSSFVHLHRMGRDQVSGLAARLLALSAAERAGLPGLQPKRAGVIAAGALILDELMGLGGWCAYTASESDSLMGLLACIRARLDGRPSPIGAWEPSLATVC